MSGGLNFGKSKSRSKPVTTPQELIPFSQGTLRGGGPGSFNDVLFELSRLERENSALSAADADFSRVGSLLDAYESAPDPRAALLREQALTSTNQAASAGALLAREAAGGRGGLAFGSGAGEVARRTAQDVAGIQSQALGQALLGAEEIRDQRSLAAIQGRQALGGLRLQQAGVIETRRERGLSARQQFLELMAQIAAAGTSGVGGGQTSRSNSFNFGITAGGKG